jgi:hypothetical protein
MNELPLTREALERFGRLFIATLKDKIESNEYPYGHPTRGRGNKVASGNLLNSLTYEVVDFQGQAALKITYADYFKYVNLGRKPRVKRVPLDVLLEWISIKGIRGKTKSGRQMSNRSLAWAVQTNIFKYGIRPANIYDKTLDNIEDLFDNPPPDIAEELEYLYDAIEGDINNLINNMIEDELKSI